MQWNLFSNSRQCRSMQALSDELTCLRWRIKIFRFGFFPAQQSDWSRSVMLTERPVHQNHPAGQLFMLMRTLHSQTHDHVTMILKLIQQVRVIINESELKLYYFKNIRTPANKWENMDQSARWILILIKWLPAASCYNRSPQRAAPDTTRKGFMSLFNQTRLNDRTGWINV